MLKDLLYESSFIIQYIPKNKIIVTILANICSTEYGLIDKRFAKIVSQVLEIQSLD